MAISFGTFRKCISFVVGARKPVMLRSRHGVGKSEVVYQFAKDINIPVVERRASQMTEGDLLGLPKLRDGMTSWLPPDWFKQSCDNAVLLFIDELDRATTEVRQGFFELADSRKIAGHMLHPNTLVFSAVNSGHATSGGSEYQVGDMDPAELDRWAVFDLDPSVDEWLSWGKENCVEPKVLNFIRDNARHLEHKDAFEPNKVYPSRRSWVRFGECLKQIDDIESDIVFHLATAHLGLEAAVAFQDFIKTQCVLHPKDVVDEGQYEKVKNLRINEQLSLVNRIKDDGYWLIKLSPKQVKNICETIKILPSEIGIKMYCDCLEIAAEGNITNKIAIDNYEGMNEYLCRNMGEIKIV